MNIPYLKHLDIKGRRVLVRADLNVPVEDGTVIDDSRIEAVLPTLRYILEAGGRAIIAAHLGRPAAKRDPSLSLHPVADVLGEALGNAPVAFAEDCVGEAAEKAAARLGDGQCLVLENLRFHAGETGNDPAFADALARLADLYVNDAFSASHRAHASIVGLPSRLPAAAGLLMMRELDSLERHLGEPQHPYVAIFGGAKAETKIPLIEDLRGRADRILLGGVIATTFLKAQGDGVGRSKVGGEKNLEMARSLLRQRNGAEIILPLDVVVAREMRGDADAEIVSVDDVAQDMMILDVGPETIRRYREAIGERGTVVWNGTLGAAELEPFARGSYELAAAITERTSRSGLVSVAGGGDTIAFIRGHGFLERFTYASMAGGAFLKWLSGEELPGVSALRQQT
ncbi:MAG: phosphoglycerate kinase [Alphaproteobacteria bacterium]|nr:phosphoglycerate kinase [Alphaproteobacteria bacterium]